MSPTKRMRNEGRELPKIEILLFLAAALIIALVVVITIGHAIATSVGVDSGTVIDRRAVPEHNGLVPLQINKTWMYLSNGSPEKFELQLRHCQSAESDLTSVDCQTSWVVVSEADYNEHPIGSTFG